MAAPTEEDVNRIVRTTEQAKQNTAFVASLKMDAQQIEGTRYKFRLSEAVGE